MSESKKCCTCKKMLERTNFYNKKSSKDGLHAECKPCMVTYNTKYKIKNKNKIKVYEKEYRTKNKEVINSKKRASHFKNKEEQNRRSAQWKLLNADKVRDYSYRYYHSNKEAIKEKVKAYHNERIKVDSFYKFKITVRKLTCAAFSRKGLKKCSKTEQLLGCSLWEFKQHIEKLLAVGMTMKNYGKWHIDHIIPLASAKTEEELIKLCHYTNLQPLWAIDNIRKGARIETRQEENSKSISRREASTTGSAGREEAEKS